MTWIIVPAAGTGRRMGSGRPKTELPLLGQPLLTVTLTRLAQCKSVSGLMVVEKLSGESQPIADELNGKPLHRVQGGAERMHSVLAGLMALPPSAGKEDFVAVHDAARPCIKASLIERVIDAARRHGDGAIAAVPVSDTLKMADDEQVISQTVDRANLWRAQTPQVFRRGALTRALQACVNAGTAVSDESMAMEQLGVGAKLVMGDASNIKVTHPEDLRLAELFLEQERA